jgi:uncharacterized protein YbjT (DUF2867 family)
VDHAHRLGGHIRLSVLNTSATSLGINQRAHWNIDFAAEVAGLPYATIRPAIFSASLLAGAAEVKASRTWTGLAGTGRVALIDHRDAAEAAVRVITDPGTWGRHHDLTGPRLLSWPEAMQALSAELGEQVSFVTTSEQALLGRLTDRAPAAHPRGLPAREPRRLQVTAREIEADAPGFTGR